MNIYQIKQEFIELFNTLEENGGELTPELEEQLKVTKDSFKEKIKTYTDVVKTLNSDIESIKVEQKRLKELADSKQKTIDRLKSIIIDAIEEFGDTKKTGVRYVDYGTGKVSIRKTTAVDVDTNLLKAIAKGIKISLCYNRDNNQLDVIDRIDFNSIANYMTLDENGFGEAKFAVSEDDLNHANAKISFRVPIHSITDGSVYNIIKDIVNRGSDFDIDADVSKTSLKSELEENGSCAPNLAKLVTNKNIIIK